MKLENRKCIQFFTEFDDPEFADKVRSLEGAAYCTGRKIYVVKSNAYEGYTAFDFAGFVTECEPKIVFAQIGCELGDFIKDLTRCEK